MAEKNKIPQIRFKGFTDEWEESTLNEICSFQYGQFNNNPNNGGVYPVYGANGIIGGYTEYNAENSVIIGHMGEYAGSVLWGEGKHFVTYNGTITTPKNDVLAKKFDYYLLFRLNINKICGGSGQPFLAYATLNKLSVAFPFNRNEQKNIASYFQQLDQLISLHQRKYEKLVNIKKAMLQKMFPKENALVPEIRFKGFEGEWERKTLNNEVEIIGTGKSYFVSNIEKSDNTPYEILGSTSIIGYSSEFDYTGDFILTARVGANAGEIYKYSGEVKISDNTVFIQSKNLNFLYFLLTNYNLKKLSFGTGQPLIKASELSNLKLMFAYDKKEQGKIGEFFEKLDRLINQHQLELTKLKNIKKSFLEKMFV